jgi:hypothetical protein
MLASKGGYAEPRSNITEQTLEDLELRGSKLMAGGMCGNSWNKLKVN